MSSPDKALNAILPLIAAGQAYEAHQKARTFASRSMKTNAYDTAIQVLFQSARELLKNGHAGSGTDLGAFLIEVYYAKEQQVDNTSRGILTQLIALTGSQGTWRKTLIDKAIAWSADFGTSQSGDPGLQHYISGLLYKEGSYDLAEPHLLAAGDRDSARLLATMMIKWMPPNDSAAMFATRGVLPFLLCRNILAARVFLSDFIAQLIRQRPSILSLLSPITLSSDNSADDEIYITTDPTLNFLQLTTRTCQRGNGLSADIQRQAKAAFIDLFRRYKTKSEIVASPAMNKAAAQLGDIYFGIPLPRQGNPLHDMMTSLFGKEPAVGSSSSRGPFRGRGRGVGPGPSSGGLD